MATRLTAVLLAAFATACGGGGTSSDLNLGEIKSFSGAQQYALPDDGSTLRYAVIWCRGVNLPFGFGELR